MDKEGSDQMDNEEGEGEFKMTKNTLDPNFDPFSLFSREQLDSAVHVLTQMATYDSWAIFKHDELAPLKEAISLLMGKGRSKISMRKQLQKVRN